MMSSHLALPREGHLEQVLHICAYLKKYHNYGPSDPVVDENDFERRDWTSSEFGHVEGEEECPANMPEQTGHGFITRAKVDADHASDTVSRQSRTGFLIYLDCVDNHDDTEEMGLRHGTKKKVKEPSAWFAGIGWKTDMTYSWCEFCVV